MGLRTKVIDQYSCYTSTKKAVINNLELNEKDNPRARKYLIELIKLHLAVQDTQETAQLYLAKEGLDNHNLLITINYTSARISEVVARIMKTLEAIRNNFGNYEKFKRKFQKTDKALVGTLITELRLVCRENGNIASNKQTMKLQRLINKTNLLITIVLKKKDNLNG